MINRPPLTVVLPARNAEATIAQAIASTLNQSFTDFELWVLENGSKDRTAEIAGSFKDPRLRLFELGPVGFEGALQYAIENSSSEWLARMDADDLMFPNRLEVQMALLTQRSDLVLVGSAYALLTPFGHIFERVSNLPSREINTAEQSRRFADPSVIFKRSAALEVGGIDREFNVGDLSLWLRLLRRGKGWNLAEPLLVYRLRPESMSRSADFYRQGIQARLKYAPETLRHPQLPPAKHSAWSFIAGLELLARDGNAVRQVANFIEPDNLKTARWLRRVSSWGRIGYAWYRLYDRSGYRYRRRPDWERLFSPLVENNGKSPVV
jgi:glycosyltransferase involved in cell wall biosynthesis